MESEWFEIAYINFDEAILHGQMQTDAGEKQVRKVLSREEAFRVEELGNSHRREMNKLLKGFVA